MLKNLLISVFALFMFSTCDGSENTLKDIEEARQAVQKTLNATDDQLYKLSARSFLTQAERVIKNFKIETKEPEPTVKTPQQTSPSLPQTAPLSQLSLEERYNHLYSLVPWLKELEILKFIKANSVKEYSQSAQGPHQFIRAYWNFDFDKREKKTIDKMLLEKLEDAAKDPGVKSFDIDKYYMPGASPLKIIRDNKLTLQDVEKNQDLASDLNQLYGRAFNHEKTDKLMNYLQTNVKQYKETGQYKMAPDFPRH